MEKSKKKEIQKIVLIVGSKYTQEALEVQLKKFLGDKWPIESYSIDEEQEDNIDKSEESLKIFSSFLTYKEYTNTYNNKFSKNSYLIASRAIDHQHLAKVLLLPKGEEILFVNDDKQSTLEAIQDLEKIGIDTRNFKPYYPGSAVDISSFKIAITPGELDLVPSEIEQAFNIGVRVLDLPSLLMIFQKLGMEKEGIETFAAKYNEDFVIMAKKIADMMKEADKLSTTLKKQLGDRGHYAKYSFKDIIGSSTAIEEQKNIAKKLAPTDLSILIQGENGTGKELFASAIHHQSNRKKYPFVAVNFSALPENLIEAELFGYEEGAFTGARKGGKVGLFQQANGGTIFLDEIGDISQKIQTRLLRVLQEKEIMKVGADKIIPIDVRIIAATNKNLEEMVKQGEFREDLFYRLKMGRIFVPPLRDRSEDIPEIVKHIEIKQAFPYQVSTEVLEMFKVLEWRGNVRELINTLLYMGAICEGKEISVKELPKDLLLELNKNKGEIKMELMRPYIEITIIEKEILQVIEALNNKGVLVGREKIFQELNLLGKKVSMYQVRKNIEGLIHKNRIGKKEGYGLHAINMPN